MAKPTILILGAAHYQVPVIREAVKQGFHVISCSYRSTDPGHQYAQLHYDVDISDKDAVYNLAKKIQPDYILGHVSETAVHTAVHVSQRLGLPGPSVETVKLLIEKDRFRKFQKMNGFAHPSFVVLKESEIKTSAVKKLSFPVVVKPVDACGSRGVVRINEIIEFKNAAQYALSYSKQKIIIVEEVIKQLGPQITGDGFMHNGHLEFIFLGDHYIHSGSKYPVAYSTAWPTRISDVEQRRIGLEAERLLLKAGYTDGPFNIDGRLGLDNRIHIIEIAPRNGGNYVSQCTYYATGVNLEECQLKQIQGREPDFERTKSGYSANYILHSHTEGIFRDLNVSDELNRFINKQHILIGKGEKVNIYRNLGDALGVLLFEFDSHIQMRDTLDFIHDYVMIEVDQQEDMKIN